MEGRTIARPDNIDQDVTTKTAIASMEGRTIARPDQHRVSFAALAGGDASMEGRTIARPDECECTVQR